MKKSTTELDQAGVEGFIDEMWYQYDYNHSDSLSMEETKKFTIDLLSKFNIDFKTSMFIIYESLDKDQITRKEIT